MVRVHHHSSYNPGERVEKVRKTLEFLARLVYVQVDD